MLKITKLSAAVFVLIAGAATAQEADPNIDVNGDGFYSYPEVASVYPDLSDEQFTVIDTTGDGLLDMAEVMAAQEAGLMPASE